MDEIRCAHQTGLASPQEIFDMVTTTPAQIFKLPKPWLYPGAIADLMITPMLQSNYFENLQFVTPANIKATLINGTPVYADGELAGPLSLKYQLSVSGVKKRTWVDFHPLFDRLKKRLSTATLESNPLWNIFDA